MAIEFACPTCNGALEVGDELAGRVIRCGGCMTMLRVPEASGAPAAPPSPFETEPRPAPPPPRSRPADSPTGDESRPRDYDDPYGERPRRARRRPPPPTPAGRGVFFWLVVVGAIMLLGVVACCGGLFLLLPDAKWEEHKSDNGGFAAEMPGEVQQGIDRAAGLDIDPGARSEGAILPKAGKMFVVLYRDVKPEKDRKETDEQLVERAIQNIQKAVESDRPLASKPVKVGDLAGREVAGRGQKGWFAARVVVADSRLYIAIAGGGLARAGDRDVRRFLDSFKVTDEELLKKAKDAAKQPPAAPPRRPADDD